MPAARCTPSYRPSQISAKVNFIYAACCRQHEMGECNRRGLCNFMHLKYVSEHVKKDLHQAQAASIAILKPEKNKRAASPIRAPMPTYSF